jgi:hypothetical protein
MRYEETIMAFYGIVAGMGIRTAMTKAIEKKLREKGAVSRKTRIMPEEAGITSKRELGWIDHLAKQGRIGRTKDGKIWWIE